MLLITSYILRLTDVHYQEKYNKYLLFWSVGELSSKRNRLGHSRRACEVNFIEKSAEEPIESNPRKAWELVEIPVL